MSTLDYLYHHHIHYEYDDDDDDYYNYIDYDTLIDIFYM